jgi:hypothetical protein
LLPLLLLLHNAATTYYCYPLQLLLPLHTTYFRWVTDVKGFLFDMQGKGSEDLWVMPGTEGERRERAEERERERGESGQERRERRERAGERAEERKERAGERAEERKERAGERAEERKERGGQGERGPVGDAWYRVSECKCVCVSVCVLGWRMIV